jgi:hypothetical protein
MSKSILVIDTPCSCVTCPLSFYSGQYKEHQCRGREYYRTIENYEWQTKQMCRDDIRPEWCPLSPIHENPFKYLEKYLLGEMEFDAAIDSAIEELNRLIYEYIKEKSYVLRR